MDEVRTELAAKTLAKVFAVAEFGVTESAITIINTMPVTGAIIAKHSYSIELSVMHNNGTWKSHQLAVDVKSGNVTLIY
ncbi:MAG: hypothetical protein ACD_25C00225G0002 [uncultured bacterium]|uniref:PepSY domain-containing protein n=1 Tax=candidate division WWE3 bacterium TaxID=2053526 RepID=A0A3D0ZPS7_UNCKA|nr:MAG: hypothetical protein ACD_25C00225G0002 [uncultured bacterium]OGC58198.1 MAG: hypothetical protein A2245_00525 [candidate division WWE3 bacterium RIFOXYA2_FULL_43_12]OGC65084.1 MAG: hypothetical protein A2274_01505 [candidate division WWE3 bacterium RIFOXYA12_FULL_43_11]OGC73212.1 MAG: hypothetical protein A2337_00810 [candidate division WWE3 bacterium RIFOXYB2_FULL_43_9]OGC75863.1 MAG: hypothetical protein A2547_02425 [candidate division WWE3 bacterium RIFOXYD2_FULL_43_10]HBY09792.1 hy